MLRLKWLEYFINLFFFIKGVFKILLVFVVEVVDVVVVEVVDVDVVEVPILKL